jgi:hypothetical protein
MSHTSNRRLSRLKKLTAPLIAERKRREAEEAAWQRQAARDHATKLVTLILHGDPHIEEPLAIAWRRALDCLKLSGIPEAQLPEYLRALVVARLPGDTENAKFAHVLGSAPLWLRYFCMASIDGIVLGFDLPKNSEPLPELGRKGLRDGMDAWPDLPTGTLGAGDPIPKPDLIARETRPSPLHALSLEEAIDLIGLLEKGEENWSRRERLRLNEIMDKVDNDELTERLITDEGDPKVGPA